MKYTEVAKINVNDHIEKKNGLSYLSWAFAVDQLMRLDENASWYYPEPKLYGETMMIFCTVKAFGRERTAQLPVMDYKNKPIANPDSFAVNTAMQRCLAKAIALHGLGLYIYAGEDVPEEESAMSKVRPERRKMIVDTSTLIKDALKENRDYDAFSYYESITDNDEKLYLWSFLDSTQRSRIKAQGKAEREAEPKQERKAA